MTDTTTAIPANHVTRGVFVVNPGDTITINGPGRLASGAFVDNGTATIDADVIGRGQFIVGNAGPNGPSSGALTFGGMVGAAQRVIMYEGAHVTIDAPAAFHATIGFVAPMQPDFSHSATVVDLVGITAAGYSLKSDLLRLTDANGATVDTVRLQPGFAPQVVEAAGSTFLTLGYGTYEVSGTHGGATILQQHG